MITKIKPTTVADHAAWAAELARAGGIARASQLTLSGKYGANSAVVKLAAKVVARIDKAEIAFGYEKTTAVANIGVGDDNVEAMITQILLLHKIAGDLWGQTMAKIPISSAGYKSVCLFGESVNRLIRCFAFECYEPVVLDHFFPFPAGIIFN